MSAADGENNGKGCGCGCDSAGAGSSSPINPPGQPTLNYRIGTHSSFLQNMLARLNQMALAAEGGQVAYLPTTRDRNDPAIALMDAGAMVADVLAFYQERIANEAFLSTATERRSMEELARATGYELSPGVAAGAFLAFTVEEKTEPPGMATIPVGTQVQSIPVEQGHLPQVFETIEPFDAYAKWNALRPQQSEKQQLSPILREVYFKGIETGLKPGDLILLIGHTNENEEVIQPRRVRTVSPDYEDKITAVSLEENPDLKVHYFQDQSAPVQSPAVQTRPTNTAVRAGSGIMGSVFSYRLEEDTLQSIMKRTGWTQEDMSNFALFFREALPDDFQVYALREKAGIFGHTSAGSKGRSFLNWASRHRCIYLDRTVSGVVQDSWFVLENVSSGYLIGKATHAADVTLNTKDFYYPDPNISTKVTGLFIDAQTSQEILCYSNDFSILSTTVYAKSDELTLAHRPLTTDIPQGIESIVLDEMVPDLSIGQYIAWQGEKVNPAGVTASEILRLTDIVHSDGRTTLTFKPSLSNSYQRGTVYINANVVRASHGESVNDILGSGDGLQINQRFVLKRTPLTFVSAPTASGNRSTLTVRVNGVLWEEAAFFHGLDGNSQKYVVRRDTDNKTTVIFGDGINGARLPTGQDNVTAAYRSGIGLDGEVTAKSLKLLNNKPLNVREVINPLAAGGAGGPETVEQAKSNVPLPIRTLGRLVSLSDFEDFCRAFAGIGKAQAVPLLHNGSLLVHLTIASESGKQVEVNSELFANLRQAIDQARDPQIKFLIDRFDPLYFNIEARVKIDRRYQWPNIEKQVRACLLQRFGFDEREFGQPISAAEIIGAIHEIQGVVAVDLDSLKASQLKTPEVIEDETTPTITLSRPISVGMARPSSDCRTIEPAQLMLVNPYGIHLEDMGA